MRHGLLMMCGVADEGWLWKKSWLKAESAARLGTHVMRCAWRGGTEKELKKQLHDSVCFCPMLAAWITERSVYRRGNSQRNKILYFCSWPCLELSWSSWCANRLHPDYMQDAVTLRWLTDLKRVVIGDTGGQYGFKNFLAIFYGTTVITIKMTMKNNLFLLFSGNCVFVTLCL